MKKNVIVTAVTSAFMILLFLLGNMILTKEPRNIKAGFIYVGDGATAYTKNFMLAQEEIEEHFGSQVTCIARYNIAETTEEQYIQELVDEGCDIIFGASYGYASAIKEAAIKNPQVQFCMATGDNAQVEPIVGNYHTYMGHIAEGRYATGVVAGMKLNEMVEEGKITREQCKVGYVAAFPYAEVISGYTAFFLGVRSVCPDAIMEVKYADTWSSYTIEMNLAKELIESGCVIISQHSDTAGPAVACETADTNHPVYLVSYNASMIDVAPQTALTGCRIDWAKYEMAAVQALVDDKPIESVFKDGASINGTDVGAGFKNEWVDMLELNGILAAEGTKEAVEKIQKDFASRKIEIFSGPYTGKDPWNPDDVIDLSVPYKENESSSAPTFHYVLDDVIQVTN